MDESRPPRLRTARTIRQAIVATAIAIVVAAAFIYPYYDQKRQYSFNRVQPLQWVRTGAAYLARTPSEAFLQQRTVGSKSRSFDQQQFIDTFKQWSIVTMQETSTVATGVLNAQGKLLTSWPEELKSNHLLRTPKRPDDETVYELDNDTIFGNATVAVVPIRRRPELLPLGYLCLIADISKPPYVLGRSSLEVMLTLALPACLVTVVAMAYVRRRVIYPLTRLDNRIRKEHAIHLRRLDKHDSELDAITHVLHKLSEDLDSARNHAGQLSSSLDNLVARETRQLSGMLRRAERDAEMDALTGLTNRRFIEQRLEGVYQEQLEVGKNLVVAMFDVDNFKPLNDTEGHAAGDEILRFIGELLRGSLRDSDVGIRYGGDEFVVIFVGVTRQQAFDIAQRIVRMFAQRIAALPIETPVTLSAGIASLHDESVSSGAELLARADEALYRSKNSGKNLVM